MSFVDDLKNLQNLDPSNPGLWPLPIQLIAAAVACVLLLYAGWHFDISTQRDDLASEQSKEQELRDSFEQKQKKAANLNALKEQMKEMEQSFGDMLRQLPNKTEVAGLIVDISQTGLAAGLEFDLFQPTKETQAEFYSVLRIKLKVKGTYHQLGEFISGIAALPRIVTTHDIEISKDKKGGLLSLTATAKTYRAQEES